MFAEANGYGAFGEVGRVYQANPRRARAAILEINPVTQALQRRVVGDALDLRPVGAGMGVMWRRQAGDQGAGVGKNEQPFAVVVESPGSVDAADVDVVGQRGAVLRVGELGEDAVGLPEAEDAGRGAYLTQKTSPSTSSAECSPANRLNLSTIRLYRISLAYIRPSGATEATPM